MYVLCSTLYQYYYYFLPFFILFSFMQLCICSVQYVLLLLLFAVIVILFTVMSLYVCSVQYVVFLLLWFADICYSIYSYVAVCMFLQYVLLLLLFAIIGYFTYNFQLYVCSVQYVMLLLFADISYFIYLHVAVCVFCAGRCVVIIYCYFFILFTFMQLYVCSVQYVVLLFFADICNFLINIFFPYSLYSCFLVLQEVVLFCVSLGIVFAVLLGVSPPCRRQLFPGKESCVFQ